MGTFCSHKKYPRGPGARSPRAIEQKQPPAPEAQRIKRSTALRGAITTMEVINNKEEKPLEFYLEKYREMDPAEMAARCGLPYDGEARTITMDLLGEQFLVSHPDYTVVGPSPLTNAERILFLRYLLDGRKSQPLGQYLTYRDFPWGEVYLQQFTGRCIKRFAFSYGAKLDLLNKIMEKLTAKKLSRSDCGWEVELMEGLTIQFLLWAGDDEFPPNAQILFSDNFRYAFTAEDLANIGDIVLNRMKRIGGAL